MAYVICVAIGATIEFGLFYLCKKIKQNKCYIRSQENNICKKFKRKENDVYAFRFGVDRFPKWFIKAIHGRRAFVDVNSNGYEIVDEDLLRYASITRWMCSGGNKPYVTARTDTFSFGDIAHVKDWIVLDELGNIKFYNSKEFKKLYKEIKC